jgi:uncharacterized membrane protein YfcA
MDWQLVVGFVAGLAVAVITAPVGVSGAVFLLPVQISVLGVASPAVTPTNLLFNVISVPGALLRYRRRGTLASALTARLLSGTLPGVVLGAVVRVFLVPDGSVFRLLVAGLLLPLGSWLVWRARPARRPRASQRRLSDPVLVGLGFGAGLVGGVYGIGGGSLIAPILVGVGYLVTEVAPAALVSTFVTSCVGAATYALIAVAGTPQAAPLWPVGIACGLGGLVGGYVGASLQPRVPQGLLTAGLGVVAIVLALVYGAQVALR